MHELEGLFQIDGKLGPRRRRRNGLRKPKQEWKTELGLQLPDVPADGAVRDAKFGCRSRHGA